MGLLSIFRKKQRIYSIVDVDFAAEGLVNYKNGIQDMIDRRIDGMIIRNFLTKENAQQLINGFENMPLEDLIIAEKGFTMYPTPFAKFSHLAEKSPEEHEEKLLEAEGIWREFPKNFGFDFYDHLKKGLESMSDSRTVQCTPGENGKGFYSPAGFKRLTPGHGKFTVHCGNFFHKEFSHFFSYLKKLLPIEKQLSYFVTLQQSKEGGELILYDVSWDDAEVRLKGGEVIQKKDGTNLSVTNQNELKQLLIKPNSGDLFIFASAKIWHKVTIPMGSERYTLGGFLGVGHDDKSVFLWS